MVNITATFSIERLVLTHLLCFCFHSVSFEVNSDNMDELRLLQSLTLNFVGDAWSKAGLLNDFILDTEQDESIDVNARVKKLMSTELPLMILQLNSDNHKKDTTTSFKLLERQRVLKLFNEIYNDKTAMIMEQLKRAKNIHNGIELLPALVKRQPVRRCGTLLIKHIQKVCNGCLRSATDAGFSKITDICCTQRACDDGELKPFCC
uniref:Secreted protein n=1 Tax=Meloidogyne hapla TaxID=6305 RepID=A0A1I8BPK3_MELHA